VHIPYVKGVSEKFKHTGNRYNIRMIFKIKHTLRSSLMKTRLERHPQQVAQCIYSIPCECGRSYTGETGRLLAMLLREHRYDLKVGLLEKSKLAQHGYKEAGMKLGFWKLKITADIGNPRNLPIWHTSNPISQPS
jgi:hypothetical protein